MDQDLQPYILIAGQGRSGTNWMLDILDLCDVTWCRNEPNELAGSVMEAIADGTIVDPGRFPEAGAWASAIRKLGLTLGDRDSIGINRKAYYRNRFFRQLLKNTYDKPQVMKMLSPLNGYFGQQEWHMPEWFFSTGVERISVIKINQKPGWTNYVLGHDNAGKVIHIVRHPGGFLNSWANRYLSRNDADKVLDDNKNRLRAIARVSGDWGQRFGDLEKIGLEESELFYWLYANEETWLAGRDNPRYKLVIFENLSRNFVEEIDSIMQFTALSHSPEQQEKLIALGDNSMAIARGWQEGLNQENKELVTRILKNTELGRFWHEDAV